MGAGLRVQERNLLFLLSVSERSDWNETWTVNGADLSLINAPAPVGDTGEARITVRLRPGTDNVVRLGGGYGEIAIESLNVSLFND